MSRLGLELGPRTIRAVRVGGWPKSRARTMEVSWDPENPAEAVAALREHLGPATHVMAAVDLSLLHVKRLQLPPLPLEEKRRLLGLEPDRFFAVRGAELVFSVRDDDDLVFAAREPLVAAWVDALETLGRLERIEPAPLACARALARARVESGLVFRDGRDEGVEALEIEKGRLRWARRLYGRLPEAAAALAAEASGADIRPGTDTIYVTPWNEETGRELSARLPNGEVRAPPRVADLDPAYLAAYGAALEVGRGWREALLTADLERKIVRRRRARLASAAVACAAALLFALLSVDAYRARAEGALETRIAELRAQAADALALQERAEALGRRTRAVSAIEAGRPDLLRALLELSERLPAGAWIRSIRAAEGEWEIDGYARDAAALIPLFENDPRFEDVRFRSATSRAQVGTETYENFSLALRVVRAS